MTDTLPPEVAKRRKMERAVISAFVRATLKAGYTISVNDGEEYVVKRSSNYKAIMDSLMSVDEETLVVRDSERKHIGTVFLVYGNDGWDVINDHSTKLEELGLMTKANEVCDRLQG